MTRSERFIRANISLPVRKGEGYVIHEQVNVPNGIATAVESHILPDYGAAMEWRANAICAAIARAKMEDRR